MNYGESGDEVFRSTWGAIGYKRFGGASMRWIDTLYMTFLMVATIAERRETLATQAGKRPGLRYLHGVSFPFRGVDVNCKLHHGTRCRSWLPPQPRDGEVPFIR